MKKRKMFIWIVAIIAVITISLIVVGMFFSKTEDEKRNGLSGHFDVSKRGTIAYVNYTDGKPEIRLYYPEQSHDTRALQLENDKFILDPTFSNDGSTITYITANKNLEEELKSTVYQYNLKTKEGKELFSASSAITEIEFSPNEESLFYLKAGVFKNYSPIASKRPHDFDVHEFIFKENKHVQHTNLKKYAMDSLTVSLDGKSVFVQMPDDAEVKSAEDSFNVKQRVFEIPLDNPKEQRAIIIDPDRKIGIFDFTIIPNSEEIIYQAISNQDSGETFQYELYKYNMETDKNEQLTNLKEYAGNPKINTELNKIYFTVDRQFAQRNSDYRLYKMNMDGTEVEEIILPNSKENL